PSPIICQGTWEGEIAFIPAGANSFGYDPIFWIPNYQCTAAQLSPEVKNKISHRACALQKLISIY
ncbi:MAG: non-canonical purine NTP pyrophosphatase, partial [bacterium]